MNILVVEDEAITAEEIVSSLNEFGYENTHDLQSGEKAIEYVKENSIDLILMDVDLKKGINGIETIKRIKEFLPDISVIYITAFSDDDTIDTAVKTDPISYLIKPFKPYELKAAVKIAKNKNIPAKNKGESFIHFFNNRFSFNIQTKELFHNGVEIKLRPKEVKLLELILENKDKGFIRNDQILYTVWDIPPKSDKTKRTLISSLNNKFNFKILKGNYGEGYRILI